jgi:outer membrane protein TolC
MILLLVGLWAQVGGLGPTGSSTSAVGLLNELAQRAARMPPLPPLRERDSSEPPITVAEVLDSVRARHPSLFEAEARRRSAEGKARSARGHFDPTVTVDGTTVPAGYYDYTFLDAELRQATPLWGAEVFAGYRLGFEGDHDFSPYGEELETLDTGEVRFGFDFPLLKNGALDEGRTKIRQTRAGLREAQADVRVRRLSLFLGAVDAYWTWEAAVQRYAVALQLTELARLRDGAVRSQILQGSLPELERAESLRAVLDRQATAWKDWQTAQKAAVKLSLFLRDENGQPVVPRTDQARMSSDPITVDVAADDIERALRERPEMEALAQKREKAEIEVAFRRVQRNPKVDFKFQVSKDIGDLDLSLDELGPGAPPGFPTTIRTEILGPTEVKLGLVVQAPLLLRKERGEFERARADLEALNQKIRFTRDKLQADLRNLRLLIQALQSQAQVAIENRRAAEIAAGAARRRFQVGTADLFQVFLQENKAGEAAVKAIDAVTSQRAAAMVWDFATCRTKVDPAGPC